MGASAQEIENIIKEPVYCTYEYIYNIINDGKQDKKEKEIQTWWQKLYRETWRPIDINACVWFLSGLFA